MDNPTSSGRASGPDSDNDARRASDFVWPPPEEDLDDWHVISLFAPSQTPLPEPVLVVVDADEVSGASGATDAAEAATTLDALAAIEPELEPEAALAMPQPAMSSPAATSTPLVMTAGSARARIQSPERLPSIERSELPETLTLVAPAAAPAIQSLAPIAPPVATPPRVDADAETLSLTTPPLRTRDVLPDAPPLAIERPTIAREATTVASEPAKPRVPQPSLSAANTPRESKQSASLSAAGIQAALADTLSESEFAASLPLADGNAATDTEAPRAPEAASAVSLVDTQELTLRPDAMLAMPRPQSGGAGTRLRVAVAAMLVCTAGVGGYIGTRWLAPRDVADSSAAVASKQAATAGAAEARSAAAGVSPAADGGAGASTASAPTGAAGSGATLASAAPAANDSAIAGESSLEVRSTPSGARVIFGGRERGFTPLVISGVPPGRHDVMVEGPFPRVLRRVDVTAGRRAVLIVGAAETAAGATSSASSASGTGNVPAAPRAAAETQPIAAGATGASPRTDAASASANAATGRLIVQSPLALDVIANGRRIGNSGDGSLPVMPGSHELELVNDSVDYREVTTVHISPGQRLVLPVEVPQSTLTVEASPGTHVWVDGRDVGEISHTQLALPIGPHEVRFRHPDFGERRITALVKIGLAARAAVDFKASQP